MGGHARSKSRAITVVVLVVLLGLPTAVAWARTLGGEAVVGHPGIGGFRQSAAVDRELYVEGDPVVLTYRVCRSRPWPTRTNSGFVAEFRVIDADGVVVADTGHRVYQLILLRVLWLPGQCRTVAYEWDQHWWNQEAADGEDVVLGVSVTGDRVDPGSYRFEVWWRVSAGGEPDRQLPDPTVTAAFEIEP
jgi:hypothetical protein